MSESDDTQPVEVTEYENDLTSEDVNVVPSADEPDDLDGTAEAVDLPAEEE